MQGTGVARGWDKARHPRLRDGGLTTSPHTRGSRYLHGDARRRRGAPAAQLSIFSAEMNASCGMSTFPNWRIFFLPAFCLSSSFRFRVASPP